MSGTDRVTKIFNGFYVKNKPFNSRDLLNTSDLSNFKVPNVE